MRGGYREERDGNEKVEACDSLASTSRHGLGNEELPLPQLTKHSVT